MFVLFIFVPAFGAIPYLYLGASIFLMLYIIVICLVLLQSVKIPKIGIITFLIILSFLGIKSFQDISETGYVIVSEFFPHFLTWAVAGLILSGIGIHDSYRSLTYGYNCSWLAFFSLIILISIGGYGEDYNYMRLAYALLPVSLFSLAKIYADKKVSFGSILLFWLSVIMMVTFGSRGAFVVLFLSGLLVCGFYGGWLVRFFILVISLFLVIFWKGFVEILNAASLLLAFLGYDSYFLNKAIMVTQGGDIDAISSGRFTIYSSAVEAFSDSPFWGQPLTFAYNKVGSTYLHNVIFDLIANFGLIFPVMLFLFISVFILAAAKRAVSRSDGLFLIIIISLGLGRLLFSSSIWQRPEFWLFLFFVIASGSSIKSFPKLRRS